MFSFIVVSDMNRVPGLHKFVSCSTVLYNLNTPDVQYHSSELMDMASVLNEFISFSTVLNKLNRLGVQCFRECSHKVHLIINYFQYLKFEVFSIIYVEWLILYYCISSSCSTG
jgi:hypothetical protein